MLSIEECKKFIQHDKVPDKQVEAIRDGLYLYASIFVDNYFNRDDNKVRNKIREKAKEAN